MPAFHSPVFQAGMMMLTLLAGSILAVMLYGFVLGLREVVQRVRDDMRHEAELDLADPLPDMVPRAQQVFEAGIPGCIILIGRPHRRVLGWQWVVMWRDAGAEVQRRTGLAWRRRAAQRAAAEAFTLIRTGHRP
jgi:hypothetical protein